MAANQQAQDGLRLSRNPSAPFATAAVPPPPTPPRKGEGRRKAGASIAAFTIYRCLVICSLSRPRHLRSIAASSFVIYRPLPPCGGGSGWGVAAGDGGFDRRAGSHLRCEPTQRASFARLAPSRGG